MAEEIRCPQCGAGDEQLTNESIGFCSVCYLCDGCCASADTCYVCEECGKKVSLEAEADHFCSSETGLARAVKTHGEDVEIIVTTGRAQPIRIGETWHWVLTRVDEAMHDYADVTVRVTAKTLPELVMSEIQ
jgi:hypothetical protein